MNIGQNIFHNEDLSVAIFRSNYKNNLDENIDLGKSRNFNVIMDHTYCENAQKCPKLHENNQLLLTKPKTLTTPIRFFQYNGNQVILQKLMIDFSLDMITPRW